MESGVIVFLAGVGVRVGTSQGLELGVRIGVEFLRGWSWELELESELLWCGSRESESALLRG